MTLDLSATRKDFLFANSTNSPDLFPQVAGDYTVAFWFYHAGNPASDQTIFHYANDSDSSGSRLLTRSNGTLQSQMTTSGGATTIKSSATLTVGWHQFLMWHLLGTGTRYYLDTVQFGAHATGEFDASLTKMQLGRPFVSATPLDMQIAGFAVADAYADSTKRTTLYSGGTDPSRDANVSLPSFFKASIPMENSLVPTLGDAELGIGIAPTFADDSALFVTDGYTASRIDAVPTMRNGENIPSNGNADLILLGDSYVGFHQPIRVGSHIVNELLTATNAPLRKLQHGVTPWDESLTIATATENAKTGGEYHRISDNGSADKYKVGRDTATSRNMAVPCNHMVEHWTGSDSAGTDYASMTFQNARSPETGPLSSWLDSGTKLKVHPLIWKHEVDAIDDLRYVDNGTNTIDATLSGLAAGKFHKLPAITLDDNSTDKERTIQLRPTGPWPANKLLNWAGVNVQIEGVDEGLGIAVAADNSWSYGGFGGDQSATSPTNKNFSIGEIEPWLGAFLEGGRQAIYVLSLAGESIGEYLVKLRTEAIISQYETIHANLGMLPPRFLLLSHYVAATFAQASPYRHRFDAEDAALAFDEIAQAQSHVAHFSYYKATGGAYLHDEANANLGPNDADGPQEQWLLDYDATNSTTYATAPGRSGLDTADVHPRNRDAAVMFSQLAVKSVAANFGEGISSSAIPWQPSRSMHFNGTGHVDCGVLNLPAADQTILMNVANVVGSGYLFSSRNNRSGGLSIYRNGISVQPYIGTSGNTNVSVPQDSFVLAVVYKHAAGAISTYIDGVLVFTDTSLVGTWAIGAKTFIGARNTTLGSASFQINADIKDVRVLARAASAQEIADHYADPIKHLLDTFRHYKGESVLDVANGVDTVYDSSGNGNHSTAVGGVSTVETAPFSFANEVGYSRRLPLQIWDEKTVGGVQEDDWASTSALQNQAGGRTMLFVGNGYGIRQTGTIDSYKLEKLLSGMSVRLKVFYWDGTDWIVRSEEPAMRLLASGVADFDIDLDTPLPCVVGDTIGLFFDGGEMARGTQPGTLYYGAGDLASSAGMSTAANALLLLSVKTTSTPQIALVGDSITEGHNTADDYHGFLHDAETFGTHQANYSSSPAFWLDGDGWRTQNHGLGGAKFDWAVSTGMPSAVSSGAERILVAFGVNDLVAGRTWSEIESDLDSIRALCRFQALYFSEILPYTSGSDAQAVTLRTWNANLATWCSNNYAKLIASHDAMGQVRASTGEIDDLKTTYDDDGVHLSPLGVETLGGLWSVGIQSLVGATKPEAILPRNELTPNRDALNGPLGHYPPPVNYTAIYTRILAAGLYA